MRDEKALLELIALAEKAISGLTVSAYLGKCEADLSLGLRISHLVEDLKWVLGEEEGYVLGEYEDYIGQAPDLVRDLAALRDRFEAQFGHCQ